MKSILLAFTLLFSLSLHSQTVTKPAKLRYTKGFFNTRWELGDKDATPKEVQLHLDKHDNEASYNFKRATSLEKQTGLFLLLGSVGMLVGVLTDDETAIISYSGAVVFYSIALGTSISSKKKYEKSVNGYNKKYGY